MWYPAEQKEEQQFLLSLIESLALRLVGSLRTTPAGFSRVILMAGFSVIQESKTENLLGFRL